MGIAISLRHNRTVRPSVWMMALGFFLAATSASAAVLPAVGSGTLVAQFQANASTVAFDANNHVSSWTATNNPAILLNAEGPLPQNIVYDATGMNGNPTIVVNDIPGSASTSNRVLRGGASELGAHTSVTIFWLGYYAPGRVYSAGTSLGDADGQYVYSWGVDGADGTQFDHQIDSGHIELFGGGGDQIGNSITGYNGQYTIWHTYYGQDSPVAGIDTRGHQAFATNTTDLITTSDLGVDPTNGGNYSVSGNLVLFGYQNGSGVSGGWNFVGNLSELLIYDGILDATDTAAVLAYLHNPHLALSAPVPEPSTFALVIVAALGIAVPRRRLSGLAMSASTGGEKVSFEPVPIFSQVPRS